MAAFCRFTVGTLGASAVHMRYISRAGAVREGLSGCLLVNMEDLRTGETGGGKRAYAELRSALEAHAWTREEGERARARGGSGNVRSHYRAVLSFERDLPSAAILAMAREWLQDALPTARASIFVHRDTENTHAHVWIDARGGDDRKIDLSPRRYRALGSRWERIYAREMMLRARLGFPERTDADRKEPERTDLEEREGGREEGRAGGGGEGAGRGARKDPPGRARPTPGEREAQACAQGREDAVRAAQRLRGELEGLARGRESPERDPARGPEGER